MSKQTKDGSGGPAFPVGDDVIEHPGGCPGMELRDYFAAKAMQGWIAARPKVFGEDLDSSQEKAAEIAAAAYGMADAMLDAREN